MYGTCSTYMREEKCVQYKVLVLKPERQRTLERPLKNSIEIYHK
jgi:hypothetical protein